jgi:nitrogen fixation NifU-like protein
MSLRELYQEIIVDHGKQPRNFGKLEKANHCQLGHNPLCGDKLILYVIERDGRIEDLRFQGEGCAISMASASLMTEAVKGKSIQEINYLFDLFHDLVTLDKDTGNDNEENETQGNETQDNEAQDNAVQENSNKLGKLAVFSGVAEFPVRVKCATLAWHTLKAAMENNSVEDTGEANDPKPVSTE